MIKIWDEITQMEWNIDLGMYAGQNIYYFVHTHMVNMECHFNDHNPE